MMEDFLRSEHVDALFEGGIMMMLSAILILAAMVVAMAAVPAAAGYKNK
jgi:hypothetical protein